MNKFGYLLLLVAIIAISGCNGKSKDKAKSESEIVSGDSIASNGVQSMQESKSEMPINFKGKAYKAFVYRLPDANLPHVSNEMGDMFMDNKITVRLTSGATDVFNRTFTKKDFSAVVAADFLSQSILEGIVFDKTTADGFVFAASVCYPQTDLYVPIALTISSSGQLKMEKVDRIEDEPSE